MSRTQIATLARARKNPPRIPQTHCPVCHAKPGQLCRGRNGKPSRYAHSLRSRPEESTMPDLSGWWKEMARYEGQFALPRPEGLVIP